MKISGEYGSDGGKGVTIFLVFSALHFLFLTGFLSDIRSPVSRKNGLISRVPGKGVFCAYAEGRFIFLPPYFGEKIE